MNAIPWNPLVAEVFYRAGIIEQWGTGTTNIMQWCNQGHTPLPTWSENLETVTVTFLPAVAFEEVESGPKSEIESLEERILQIIADGPVSTSELSRALGHKRQPEQAADDGLLF